MLFLLKQAWNFYKLAQIEEEISQANYQKFIRAIGAVGSAPVGKILDVFNFINKYNDQPYFKLEDLLPELSKLTKDWGYESTINIANKKNISSTLISQIITYSIEQHLKQLSHLNVTEYLDIEKIQELIPNDLLVRAQKRVILGLLRSARDDRTNVEELIQEFARLRKKSRVFPAPFLMELSKKIGLDFHVEIMHRDGQDWIYLNNIINQPKHQWSVYDVAILFNNWSHHKIKDSSLLKRIIQHSDIEVKAYMRGWIYFSENGLESFMLDEDMRPMNILYRSIEWPERVKIWKASEWFKYESEWQKIFEEFHVIPA